MHRRTRWGYLLTGLAPRGWRDTPPPGLLGLAPLFALVVSEPAARATLLGGPLPAGRAGGGGLGASLPWCSGA